MKIQCSNPSFNQSLSGPKSPSDSGLPGPHCNHSFISTDRSGRTR